MLYFLYQKNKLVQTSMSKAQDTLQKSHDPRRQRILEAAQSLLLTVGYDNATTTAIAAATHLSKATLYSWWESKESLFLEVMGHETVRLLDDWMARVEADPLGGTIAGFYRHSFLALMANPFMRTLYTRESQMLGTFVRRRGPAIYSPRYLASQELVRALQDVGMIRNDMPPDLINHILLLIQVGLVTMGEIFDQALFPSFEAVAQSLADLMQRALAPDTLVDPQTAKAAIRTHFVQLRSLIVTSFATSEPSTPQ